MVKGWEFPFCENLFFDFFFFFAIFQLKLWKYILLLFTWLIDENISSQLEIVQICLSFTCLDQIYLLFFSFIWIRDLTSEALIYCMIIGILENLFMLSACEKILLNS